MGLFLVLSARRQLHYIRRATLLRRLHVASHKLLLLLLLLLLLTSGALTLSGSLAFALLSILCCCRGLLLLLLLLLLLHNFHRGWGSIEVQPFFERDGFAPVNIYFVKSHLKQSTALVLLLNGVR